MVELSYIFITGFAVLGAYFLAEIILQLITPTKSRKLVILFPPATDGYDIESEIALIQNNLPDSEILVYATKATPDLTQNGITTADGKRLLQIVSEHINLSDF